MSHDLFSMYLIQSTKAQWFVLNCDILPRTEQKSKYCSKWIGHSLAATFFPSFDTVWALHLEYLWQDMELDILKLWCPIATSCLIDIFISGCNCSSGQLLHFLSWYWLPWISGLGCSYSKYENRPNWWLSISESYSKNQDACCRLCTYNFFHLCRQGCKIHNGNSILC